MKAWMLLFVWAQVCAAETEYTFGTATYHLFVPAAVSEKFRDKWGDSGRLIGTPLAALTIVHKSQTEYDTIKVFIGQNSIGGAMSGIVFSDGTRQGDWYFGGVAGGYLQDVRKFNENDIYSPGVRIGETLEITPIVGFETAYQINTKTKLNFVFTPVLELVYFSFAF